MVGYSVGLDLSLTSTGIAALHTDGSAFTTLVRSSGSSTATLYDKLDRLEALSQEIVTTVCGVDPLVVVLEAATFTTRKDSSAHRRAGLWWMVASEIRRNGIPVVEATPSQVKKYGTGNGSAAKEVVLLAAARKWGHEIVADGRNDRSDALFLAAMGSQYLGGDVPLKLTEYRRALLDQLFSHIPTLQTATR